MIWRSDEVLKQKERKEKRKRRDKNEINLWDIWVSIYITGSEIRECKKKIEIMWLLAALTIYGTRAKQKSSVCLPRCRLPHILDSLLSPLEWLDCQNQKFLDCIYLMQRIYAWLWYTIIISASLFDHSLFGLLMFSLFYFILFYLFFFYTMVYSLTKMLLLQLKGCNYQTLVILPTL